MAPRIIVVTGLSGSGKTTALRALEDLGYFCIDNLPAVFLRQVVKMAEDSGGEIEKVALGVDVRSHDSLDQYPEVFARLEQDGVELTVLFLDGSDEVLLRRFKETRRPHPLAPEAGGLEAGIEEERQRLETLKQRAEIVLDTSRLTVHELTRLVNESVAQGEARPRLGVTLLSFGFKYGLPHEADLVFDVRFLPNPFFEPALKPRNGEDPEVASYVLDNESGQGFLERLHGLLDFLLPAYEHEGKRTLIIAYGCTGGHHRSVAVARAVAGYLRERGFLVGLRHRDVGKGQGGR